MGERELAQRSLAEKQLGDTADARRRKSKRHQVTLVGLAWKQSLGSLRRKTRDARLEISQTARGRGRQAQAGVDQYRLCIPGNRLIVDDQAGLFVAIVQGLWLRADPEEWKDF